MTDQNPSEESYTFVDKRRTFETDSPSSEAAVPSVDTDPAVEDAGEQPGASIYDMGLYCAGLFANEALQRMGLIADQITGKAVADLPQARIAIDMAAGLIEVLDAPDSILPEPLRRDLRRTLTDLRLNFVEQSRRASV